MRQTKQELGHNCRSGEDRCIDIRSIVLFGSGLRQVYYRRSGVVYWLAFLKGALRVWSCISDPICWCIISAGLGTMAALGTLMYSIYLVLDKLFISKKCF